jgi:hypothetical protein
MVLVLRIIRTLVATIIIFLKASLLLVGLKRI